MICKNVKFNLPKNYICKECYKFLDTEALQCHDLPLQYTGNEYLAQNYHVFSYDDIISTLIKQSKYNNHPIYNKGFAHFMADYYKKNINLDIDFFVSVPIHKNRLKSRGFNQADIIAAELAGILDINFRKDMLLRHKDTKPQSALSGAARINNVDDAFSFNKKYSVNAKKIMIIDDIYTTGSTLNSCARILVQQGADAVYSFCFAKAYRKVNM